MKKKIINGILMVALVGATSTSFVSCKDTSEDVKTDLLAQVNAVRADLEPRLDQAEADIDKLETRMTNAEGRLDGVEGRMTKAEENINYLKGRVAGIRDTLTTVVNDLHAFHDSVYEVTQSLDKRMTTVENRITAIVASLRDMVTSVNINATSTNLLQNSKIFPGINCQFLGSAYGQAVAPGTFPSTDADDYVAGHGVVLTANDIKAVDGAIDWKKNAYLPVEEAAAGIVYFTINPSNIDAAEAENLKLSLVNSQNEESFVKLGKVEQDTETILEWGLTRADGDNFQPRLWKSEATIDFGQAEDLEKVIDPATQIDFVAIKDQVRTLFTNAYHAAQDVNRSNYAEVAKSETKTLIKDAAQLVSTLLQNEFPSQPALALKAEWKDTIGTRSVLSDYTVAATAYKPLSFAFGAELGLDGRTISLDKIDNLVARVANKIQNKLAAAGAKTAGVYVDFSGVNTASFNQYMIIETVGGVVNKIYFAAAPTGTQLTSTTALAGTATYYADIQLKDEVDALLAAIPADAINSMVAEALKVIDSANYYTERAQNFEVRVSNYLESYINKVILQISNDGLTRVLEPIMLYGDNSGVSRLTTGATIKAGAQVTLIPTTVSYEVIAPVYKKYVAIIGKDGKVRDAEIKTNGALDFKRFNVTFQEGDQAIVYSALDFSGKQIAKKYAINVVK